MSERGRPLSIVEQEFFKNFFARLDTAGVVSILLRNYEDFPARMGNDLDVFFRRTELARAVEIFRAALAASGGEVLHLHERDYVLAIWFRAAPGEALTIHLDFYHGAFTWHGLTYLTDAELIAGSRASGKFRAPRPAHEALSLFLTSLLWGAFYKFRYRSRIHTLLQDPLENAEFLRILERGFGPAARVPVDFSNETEPSASEMKNYAQQLRRALKANAFQKRLGRALSGQARYWRGEFKTVIAPPAICIAILGPDGSGKSTVINAVKERLEYYFGETVDRHWRPKFFREAGVALKQRPERTGPVTDPHGQKPHSVLVSAARFFYYWADYWLGWPPRVWKFKAKNHLVIFDRYAPDMWCDPKRYRLNLPRGLMKFFCRLVPQPELTFVLLAGAETIHRRKGEVPLETLRELLRRYTEASQQGDGGRAIDCSRPVNQIADEIAHAVLRHLQSKTRQ